MTVDGKLNGRTRPQHIALRLYLIYQLDRQLAGLRRLDDRVGRGARNQESSRLESNRLRYVAYPIRQFIRPPGYRRLERRCVVDDNSRHSALGLPDLVLADNGSREKKRSIESPRVRILNVKKRAGPTDGLQASRAYFDGGAVSENRLFWPAATSNNANDAR